MTDRETMLYSNVTQIQKSGSSDLSEKTTGLQRQLFLLQSQFQQDVPLHQITDHPVLEQLFTVEERRVPVKGTAKEHFSSLPRTAEGLPLSYSQERLWLLVQAKPESTTYNQALPIRFKGPLKLTLIKQCFEILVKRHDVLRTFFKDLHGEPRQFIADKMELPLTMTDASTKEGSDLSTQVHQQLNARLQEPFSLQQTPLFSLEVMKLASDDHILFLTLHQMIADRWSLKILFWEFAHLYDALLLAKPITLKPRGLHFVDFAYWQRSSLNSEMLEAQKSYWLDQLKGLPPLLQLPYDHPRPSIQNYIGRNHSFLIPESGLEAFCKAHQVTRYTVLFAVFSLLISRYSRRSDICIGTPLANRNHASVMSMVGNFANTLPMRVQVRSQQTFLEFLGHVRRTALEALANKDLPFEMLAEAFSPIVSKGYSPIFQIMFSYETMTCQATFQKDDLSRHGSMNIETLLRPIAKLDLHLGVSLKADGQLEVNLDYNRILFNRETMESMAGHFTQLLENVLAQPNETMLQIPMIPEGETQSLIETNNQTSQKSAPHQTLIERFEDWVAKRGDAIALVLETNQSQQQMTYAAFNARANQWGRILRSWGVQTGDRVAVLLDHPVFFIEALLAILKIDAAYVPLDPNASPTRINQIIEDAGPSLLLTQSHLLGEPNPILTLYIEEALASLEAISAAPLPPRTAGAACVMYTSNGKGVVISDRGILNMVCDPFGSQLKPGDNMAFAANVALKASTFEIWSSLMLGCRICVFSQSSSLDCVSFAHFLNLNAIDCVHLATDRFHFFARQKPDMFGKVGSVFFGSETADPVLINAICETEPPRRLIQAYGSAETTAHATLFEIRHALIDDQPVPIGYPISNGAAFVVDAHLQIQPANLPGELVVGGNSLGFGYLNRPALTAETFIPNDFLSEKMPFLEPGSRLYRTGDLVKRRTDGALEFLGKIGS